MDKGKISEDILDCSHDQQRNQLILWALQTSQYSYEYLSLELDSVFNDPLATN